MGRKGLRGMRRERDKGWREREKNGQLREKGESLKWRVKGKGYRWKTGGLRVEKYGKHLGWKRGEV